MHTRKVKGGRVLMVFETPCVDCGGGYCRGHEQGVLDGFDAPLLRPPMDRRPAAAPGKPLSRQPRLM